MLGVVFKVSGVSGLLVLFNGYQRFSMVDRGFLGVSNGYWEFSMVIGVHISQAPSK